MPWLLREGDVLASLELTDSRAQRRRGLLGRDHLDGAMILRPARSIHTLGMRFPLDVAWCDQHMRVLRVARVRPGRITRSVWGARAVIEAEAGAFERWGLTVGDTLEVRD